MSSDQLLLKEAVDRRNSINKPGTACLGCRRRKLKCNREPEGCHNCSKSSLQCVYPAPEVGIKRKRGPYKKDKTPHERHLEDLVKYLKPGARPDHAAQDTASSTQGSPHRDTTSGLGRSTSETKPSQATDAEALVTDALFALTGSLGAERDSHFESGPSVFRKAISSGRNGAAASQHPDTRRIFEYWHLFVSRVDPMVKVVHCPTFARKLFRSVIDDIGNIAPSTNALLFSIYFNAVNSCTPREAHQWFGETKENLCKRYAAIFEATIEQTCSPDATSWELELELLQALVLYMIPNQRLGGKGAKPHFQRAVRCAETQMMRYDGPGGPLYDAEIRRRIWHQIRGLTSRSAEESAGSKPIDLHKHFVPMPANLNDYDLAPGMTKMPQERRGITDMTFPLLRFELQNLIFGLNEIKSRATSEPGRMHEEQMKKFQMTESELEKDYRDHLDPSRPYDWMCIQFLDTILIKARLMVEFPDGVVPVPTMSESARMYLLQESVRIIELTRALAVDMRISDYHWYFRDVIQWHPVAVVVAELGRNVNTKFSNLAWAVLDPFLRAWDIAYTEKRGERAWELVNTAIERARALRLQTRPHAARGMTSGRIQDTYTTTTPMASAASSADSTALSYPMRGISMESPSDQAYLPPATQPSRHQREALERQQDQAAQRFQPPNTAQHQTYRLSGTDFCADEGALADHDFNTPEGQAELAAFKEVLNSASWNLYGFEPMEDYLGTQTLAQHDCF